MKKPGPQKERAPAEARGWEIPPEWASLIENRKPGKHRPRQITAKQKQKQQAKQLVVTLIDAAASAGRAGICEVLNADFTLPLSLFLPLLPAEHPQREWLEKCHTISPEGRVPLRWPVLEQKGVTHLHEIRERPMQIVGLLVAKVLAGDSAFFESVAEFVREAKKRTASPESSDNIAGKVAAPRAPVSAPRSDPDWFTRIAPPTDKKDGLPRLIWLCCRGFYRKGLMPTRRDIRNFLATKGRHDTNLKATLKRMALEILEEGPRPRR